jgi:hypothetical protein
MPLQIKDLGSDIQQLIYSFDDTYRRYYSTAVVPMICIDVAYCQECKRWLDGNCSNEVDDNRFNLSSSPIKDGLVKHYTKESVPSFYNIHIAYCCSCTSWIYSRKY